MKRSGILGPILDLPPRSWVLLTVVGIFAIICSSLLPDFDTIGRSFKVVVWFFHKCGHFVGYMGLTYFLIRSFNSMDLRSKTTAFILATVFGILNEFIQYFVPGRDYAVRDMFIDAAGSLAMILLLHTSLFKTWRP
ncbi:MAG: VanZ family protein [Candidatus Omnitrophica bacterium]|nr:VanZ family protein [Candidatus Omnitrophota bacterium]